VVAPVVLEKPFLIDAQGGCRQVGALGRLGECEALAAGRRRGCGDAEREKESEERR
jgi:hypothetical protein